MSILLWTFAPLIALVLATVWAHWANRPRGPVDAQESIGEYERFRTAIAGPRPVPPEESGRAARRSRRERTPTR